jgi:gliding motility-associated-like protein
MKLLSTFKKTGLSLLLSCLFFTSYGQIALSDTGNCVSHTLHAVMTGTIPTGSGITADDGYSGLINIGFTFNFYGTNYTQLLIGSNGVVNFTSTLAGAYCPWPISAALLGNPSMRNAICGPWCDMCMPCGSPSPYGTITYSTIGTAPNRRFAVTWCGDAMFSCTTQWTTSQIIIFEGSNLIEVHTAHKTVCAGWNGGYAIVGVQNAAGTVATVAPGRDFPTNWSVVAPPEAWRFTSTGPSYAVTSIPYAPAPYATSAIYWYDSSTGAYLGTGPYLTVMPVVGTTYMAAALGCNDTTKAYIHITPASITGGGGIPHINNVTFSNPTECGKCDGSITLHGVNPHQIDSLFWSIGGVAQPIMVDSALVDSTITLSNLCGNIYDYLYVKVGDCPSNQVGPITLVAPVLAITSSSFTNPTICGRHDGTITLFGLTPLKAYTLNYTRDGVAQTPTSGYVAADGSITITGLDSAVYASFAATVGLCTAPWSAVTLVDPPPFPASFTYEIHPGCNGDSVLVTNTSTPGGYNAYWNFEASDPMDSTHLYHVYATQPTYMLDPNIILTYNTTTFHKANCQTTASLTPHIDHHIIAQFTQDKDTICLGMPIQFTNTTDHANPATYHWEFGDGAASDVTDPTNTYPLPAIAWVTTLTATDSIVGCVSTATHISNVVLVTVTPPGDTSVCLRDSMLMRSGLIDIIGYNGTPTYEWTFSTDESIATNLSNNNIEHPLFFGIGDFPYRLTVTVFPSLAQLPYGCHAFGDQTIHSFPPITFTNVTRSPQIISFGSTIQLNAEGAVYYTWTPNNGTLSNPDIHNPIAKPTDSVTTYVVHGMTEAGCNDSTSIKVYVDFDNTDYIPTAFTPNGDGKNDKFHPVKFKFQKLVEMRIYNRWGQILFQSSNPEDGWDGTFNGVPQDMGAYSYEIIAAHADGSQKVYKGTVTLIR